MQDGDQHETVSFDPIVVKDRKPDKVLARDEPELKVRKELKSVAHGDVRIVLTRVKS